jgi:hypothetical protein
LQSFPNRVYLGGDAKERDVRKKADESGSKKTVVVVPTIASGTTL